MGFIKSGDDLLSRYSHYHRPQVLNGRVRNGNGCSHLGMLTGIRKDHINNSEGKVTSISHFEPQIGGCRSEEEKSVVKRSPVSIG